jgi:hypothetical protein
MKGHHYVLIGIGIYLAIGVWQQGLTGAALTWPVNLLSGSSLQAA